MSNFREKLIRTLALVAMLPIASLSVAHVATATPIVATCSAGPEGSIVVAPTGGVSSPSSPGLIVLNAGAGKQTGAIKIPLVTDVYQTNLPGYLIARTGTDLFVVDLAAQQATRLDFGDVKAVDLLPNYIQTLGSAGKRYFLLGSSDMASAFVVDLKTGVATDLVKLIGTVKGANAYAGRVAVSSDDAHIVVWDGNRTYLVATSDLSKVESIDGADFTFGPTFSADGASLIYSRSLGENAGSELIVQPLDGGKDRILKSSAAVAITLAVPGTNQLLVDERSQSSASGVLSVIDLATGTTRKLLDYAGSVLSVQFSPDGAKAIAGVDSSTGRTWTLIDLATSQSQVIKGAADLDALPGLYGASNWATMQPLDILGLSSSGGSYGGLDLQNGEFHTFFDVASNVKYGTPLLSANGQQALLVETKGVANTSDLWLLNNETGASRMLDSSLSTTGVFSPDGCWVAVSKASNVDGLRTTVLTLVSSNGDSADRSFGNGRALAWLD